MTRSLSSREKWLAGIVAAVVFVAGTCLFIESYTRQRAALQATIVSRTKQLRMARALAEELPFWEQRDQWLRIQQPQFTGDDTAGVQLLDRIKELAQKHAVLLENPALRPAERLPAYISVAVEVETKSGWPALVNFLQELQSPAQFVAVESANLKVDAAEPAQMRGRFRIARWYAAP